jgi:DNA-directed RNA polymerase subunit M/transcription elongation factor TFIIS
MPDLIRELRQHALHCATEIKRQNLGDPDKAAKAYSRARSFAGRNCPMCWTKDVKLISLQITASSQNSNTNFYECAECRFSGMFPKPTVLDSN